jgi:hypothetical protein
VIEPIIEYDAAANTLHLSATSRIQVTTRSQLNGLCDIVTQALQNHSEKGKCFLLVDISKIVVEPDLAEPYSEKIGKLCEKYILPDGLVRYGSGITRVTAQIGHEAFQLDTPHLFRTKAEALKYIGEMLAAKRQATGTTQQSNSTAD